MSVVFEARKRLPADITDQLRRRILSGELTPGDKLPPERELALQLGTNRNTLREALRALEAQGLIEARQGDAVRVRDYRRHGELDLLLPYFQVASLGEQVRILIDLLPLRAAVARQAVSLAARRASPEQLVALQEAERRLREAYNEGEPRRAAQAELATYRALVDASGNLAGVWLFNTIERVVRGLVDLFPELWIVPRGYERAWAGIIEAVCNRDPLGAAERIASLLAQTDSALLEHLGHSGDSPELH